MKYLFLTVIFMSSFAHASGKLSYQVGAVNADAKRPQYQVGLAVYEKLMKKAAFNSWTGFGSQDLIEKDDVTWFKTKNQVDMYFGKWTVSPGMELAYVKPYDESRHMGYVKLTYQLW